jgi:protein-tyrosine-phosphatase
MDLILCMAEKHKNTLIKIYPELKNKIYTLKEYTKCENEQSIDIKEPWGYDIEIYRMCEAEIEACIDKLIEKINIKSEEE